MAQEHWIGQCIWLAANELARISGRHVSTVGRRLLRYTMTAWSIASTWDGVGAASGGGVSPRRVREVYPVLRSPHRHPARDGHVHDPLHPELDEHQHPPRSVSKEGAGYCTGGWRWSMRFTICSAVCSTRGWGLARGRGSAEAGEVAVAEGDPSGGRHRDLRGCHRGDAHRLLLGGTAPQ